MSELESNLDEAIDLLKRSRKLCTFDPDFFDNLVGNFEDAEMKSALKKLVAFYGENSLHAIMWLFLEMLKQKKLSLDLVLSDDLEDETAREEYGHFELSTWDDNKIMLYAGKTEKYVKLEINFDFDNKKEM